jgi:multidrug efflux pump subunit AcrB
MKIKTNKGDFPLSQVATYHIERGPTKINRFNSIREVRVDAEPVNPKTPIPPILAELQEGVLKDIKKKFPAIKIEQQGQSRQSGRSMGEVLGYFAAAFLLNVIILVIHFRAVLQAFAIIWMIPLSWIAAAWGHGIEGMPVSILSAWGMIALSGIIINDAVVFLSKYNSNLLEGMKLKEAIHDAGISRFRPILLTSITTVAGLYPIVLEGSFQAQFLKPMAISLAYGVLIGTFFILLFFPALLMVINDVKVFIGTMWHAKRPAREDMEPAVKQSKVVLD